MPEDRALRNLLSGLTEIFTFVERMMKRKANECFTECEINNIKRFSRKNKEKNFHELNIS